MTITCPQCSTQSELDATSLYPGASLSCSCGHIWTHGSRISLQPLKKKCPFCAEDIQAQSIKCKHCGSMLGALAPNRSPNHKPAELTVIGVLGIMFGLISMAGAVWAFIVATTPNFSGAMVFFFVIGLLFILISGKYARR
jgi:phage FluMu protein Com